MVSKTGVARKPQGVSLQTTHFLQAVGWSFARLGILGILGILGVGLVWVCKHPAQTANSAAPNKKPVFIVFLVFSVAAPPIICKPQMVSKTGVARKPLQVVFFALRACLCASRFIMGALFVKSSPIPPGKNFSRLLRKLLLSASRCLVLRTAQALARRYRKESINAIRLSSFLLVSRGLSNVNFKQTLPLHTV